MIRFLLKASVFIPLMFIFAAHAAVARWLEPTERDKRRRSVELASLYSRLGLRILGLKATASGRFNREPVLLVANHLSFVDVMVIAAQHPAVFITSVEVQQSGFLGMMATLGGCVFVERRNRENLEAEKQKVASVLMNDHSVVLFAEGTSSDGAGVLPFKAAFFDSAIKAQVPVLPVALAYTHLNGVVPDRDLFDAVLYYGDMEFVPQLLRLLNLKSIDAELRFLPKILPTTDRRELSQKTYELISTTYQMATKDFPRTARSSEPCSAPTEASVV